jgi:hypothetical protein
MLQEKPRTVPKNEAKMEMVRCLNRMFLIFSKLVSNVAEHETEIREYIEANDKVKDFLLNEV